MKKICAIMVVLVMNTGCFYLNPMGAIDKKFDSAEQNITTNFSAELKTELQNALINLRTMISNTNWSPIFSK